MIPALRVRSACVVSVGEKGEQGDPGPKGDRGDPGTVFIPAAVPSPTPFIAGSPQTDRAALIDIYNALGGDNWTTSPHNWLSPIVLEEWQGVYTDFESGRVVHLDIRFLNLDGKLPPELGDLTALRRLQINSLNSSGLHEPIPPEIGNLVNLTSIHLGNNRLNGPIPPELGDLTKLERLELPCNSLNDDIPSEIGSLVNLTYLDLSCNKLTGPIPAELSNLTKLKYLFLDENSLKGQIPSELGSLTNLESLYLYSYDGAFTGCIPANLKNVHNNDLKKLGLPHCN